MADNWTYWTASGEERAWPIGTPLPRSADIAKSDFLEQFRRKLVNRFSMVLYGIPAGSQAAGYNMQVSQILAATPASLGIPTVEIGGDFQEVLEWLIVSVENLTWLYVWVDWDGTTLSGPSSIPSYTLPDKYGGWLDGENVEYEWLRRSTDGITFTTGYPQRGDVVGTWMFDDMRTVLEKMNSAWLAASYSTEYPDGEYYRAIRNHEHEYYVPWNRYSTNDVNYPTIRTYDLTRDGGPNWGKFLSRRKTVFAAMPSSTAIPVTYSVYFQTHFNYFPSAPWHAYFDFLGVGAEGDFWLAHSGNLGNGGLLDLDYPYPADEPALVPGDYPDGVWDYEQMVWGYHALENTIANFNLLMHTTD